MGLRYRRRLRIARGIWFNLSKSGGSLSLGGRGATVNLSKGGSRVTTSLPGSGLSYRSSRRPWGHAGAGTGASVVMAAIIALVIVGAVILLEHV